MITNLKKLPWTVLILTLSVPTLAIGAQGSGEFSYPELTVTPRASQRLEAEAKKEFGERWTRHIPIQSSALITLVAGLAQISGKDSAVSTLPNSSGPKDPSGVSPIVGISVGAAWLTATALLAVYYRPYTSGWDEVNAMPAKTEREQLARERYAEEALESPRRLGTKLKWLSVATNVMTGAYMAGKAQQSSFAQAVDGIAVVGALLPILFPYHWSEVAETQHEYKKKIYGPVASAGFLTVNSYSKPSPALLLSLNF